MLAVGEDQFDEAGLRAGGGVTRSGLTLLQLRQLGRLDSNHVTARAGRQGLSALSSTHKTFIAGAVVCMCARPCHKLVILPRVA